jgi:hypothetical protein
MTIVDQSAATRRFQQGLRYLLETNRDGALRADAESVLAIVTVMAYLGAYAFPNENLYGLKREMVAALQAIRNQGDIEVIVSRALELAEIFRRPWSEPQATGSPTI